MNCNWSLTYIVHVLQSSKDSENHRIAGDELSVPAIPPRVGDKNQPAPQVDLLSGKGVTYQYTLVPCWVFSSPGSCPWWAILIGLHPPVWPSVRSSINNCLNSSPLKLPIQIQWNLNRSFLVWPATKIQVVSELLFCPLTIQVMF